MPATRLQEFLENHHVAYRLIPHPNGITAQETAQQAHVSPRELAKTVILKLDDEFVMAVMPANVHVDVGKVAAFTGRQPVRLASEAEFQEQFPDCELGAMPPFGNLYGMRVFVDRAIAQDKEIAFNACSHRRLVKMAYQDFAQLVQPIVLDMAAHRVHSHADDWRIW